MRARYTESFKRQAVEKALSRSEGTTLTAITDSLGIGYSTLNKWLVKSRNQQLGSNSAHETKSINGVRKEKRPQDWSQAERLEMVIACGSLDEAGVNELCREHGLYAHHVTQWKQDFVNGLRTTDPAVSKRLKGEVRELKKELNRKDRALAETAALLVLQKKSMRSGEATRTTHDERGSRSDHCRGRASHASGGTAVSGVCNHRHQREDITTLAAAGQRERRASERTA
jgi:transposase-like protein